MGCSASFQVANLPDDFIKSSVSSEGDEIDVNVLFGALLKLSFTFDVKDSMMISMIDEIRSDKHTTFDDQFVGVEKWIQRHASPGTVLNVTEIYFLIRYVALYDPIHEEESEPTGGGSAVNNQCRLMCPYRHELATWTAEIRGKEMNRIVSTRIPTTRISMESQDALPSSESLESIKSSSSKSSSSRKYLDDRLQIESDEY
jgi:hypothetical protein